MRVAVRGALAGRIVAVPPCLDGARGAEGWAAVPGADPALRPLIEGAAGASPYLGLLMQKEGAWLAEAAGRAPEEAFDALLAEIGDGEPAVALRVAKRRAALLIGLCDLGGVWALGEVTGALTALADRAVEVALTDALRAEAGRGRRAVLAAEDLSDAAGLVTLAMGKMGAGELNYSSDIDLVCLFDESRYPPARYGEVRGALVRVVQRMVRTLADVTRDGYVFRTDLRLRPDPSVTPVCIAMEAAERYYESLGRTWERAAYIKARPAAGAQAAGAAFLERLRPFIYRRHLDFAAIQDAHDMRLRIRDHKGLAGPIAVPGHDLKLGRGGIREIEFFTQTRQLIFGGRDPSLRGRATLPMLARLAETGRVDADHAAHLAEAYVHLRGLEHRVQMIADAQTHAVPTGDEGRARLAALAGWSDVAGFEADLAERLAGVDRLIEGFFDPDARAGRAPSTQSRPETEGFRDPERAAEVIERWRGLPAMRSERARRLFARLRPAILARLAEAAAPDEALAHLDAFLAGLPAGVQIFSMLEANPHLLDLLVEICAAAPRLAAYLGRHAGVFDAVLSADFYEPLPGAGAMTEALGEVLSGAEDYEGVLDRARIWAKERRFRIGVHLLRGLSTCAEAGRAHADLAEACLRALLPHVEAEVARRHGGAPGRGAAVIALGKFGSREMTATSDLDLIVIYEAEGAPASDGARPLAAPAWYARLAKTLVSAMTAPTAEGTLYEVDMRLRPSGRQGPVAVPLSGFRTYQAEEAWTWEHLALTRARVVAGPAALAADVEAAIAEVRALPRAAAKVRQDVAEMRQRLAEAHGRLPVWEMKRGPGRMQDIELLVQAEALIAGLPGARPISRTLAALSSGGHLERDAARTLAAAHGLFLSVQQVQRVAVEGEATPEAAGRGLATILARVASAEDIDALEVKVGEAARAAEAVIAAALPAEGGA